MHLPRFGSIVALVTFITIACGKGGVDDPTQLTMTTHTISVGDHSFTIQAPEGITPEDYMGVAVHLFQDNTFKLRVTPRETRPLSQLREQAAGMHYDAVEFPVDTDTELLIRSVAGEREEWQVYVMHDIDGMAVLCESVGPVGVDWTRAHADAILESCRSLAAAE